MSTDVVEAVVRVHGGVKFYRGAANAARAYVERDRSRADDYYLAEGTGIAQRYLAGRAQHPRIAACAAVVLAANLGTTAMVFSFTPFVTQIGIQYWFLAGALHGVACNYRLQDA